MKKLNVILLSGLLLAAAVPVMAQDDARAAAKGRNRVAEIETFIAQLDSVFVVAQKEGVSAASPIYVQARGRLREAASFISKKPATKEADRLFAVCSVSASAALTQIEGEINRAKVRQMNAARDSLLFVLHKLHETINRIEGSKANALSQELEAQKAQASMLQGDLEAAKAQETLLRENLAAERERARKIQEDAQKKFDALQSEWIKVSRDARGTIITMADILFETGKADLKPTLKENLAKIAGILIVYKDPKLLIEGHTDNQGSKEFNQKLSEDRAANVKNYLIEAGVGADRLTSVGSGFSKPIADNGTKDGRAKNRRVDLIVQDNIPEEGAAAPAPAQVPAVAPPPPPPAPVPAPAQQTTTPPAKQTTLPPAHQVTTPPAQQPTTPPAHQTTTPPAKQTATPPVQQPTTPPAQQTTTPPAKQATTPPAQQTTTPPAQQTTTPPAKQTTTPPAQQTTTPPAHQTTTPPAQQTTTPPAHQTTTPPAQQTTTPPAKQTTTPPAQQTTPPAQQTPAKVAPAQQAPAKAN